MRFFKEPKVRFSRHLDLMTCVGLLAAFQAARRMVEGSTVWLGVPCSQWVWLSRGTTGRSRIRPKGAKRRYASVANGNKLVRRVCYLFLICI